MIHRPCKEQWSTTTAPNFEYMPSDLPHTADMLRCLEPSLAYGASLDAQTTLHSITASVVPALADCCVIHMYDAVGHLSYTTATHANPDTSASLVTLGRSCHAHQTDSRCCLLPNAQQVAMGVYVAEPETVACSSVDVVADDRAALRRQLALQVLVVVPLIAHGHTLGTLTCAMAESGRCYQPSDVALIEQLAAYAAVALDNARHFGEAQAALRRQQDALRTMAHDLKAPLSVIHLQAQLLTRHVRTKCPTSADHVLPAIALVATTANTMNGMLGELQDVTHFTDGQTFALGRAPTDLVALVHQSVEQPSAQRSGITIRTEQPTIVGFWDGIRLQRVVTNLLTNAIKYSPGQLDVRLTIRSELHTGQHWALLVVEDQGLGIPATDLPYIFELYHRGANVPPASHGSGIGLTSVAAIVEQHGGTIEVTSVEGRGSTFTVRLPIGGIPSSKADRA